MITATIITKDITAAYERADKFFENEAAKIAAFEVKLQINQLSARGLDSKGVAFKPYTKRYEKQREGWGLSTSPVDLRRSGGLLDGMQIIDPGSFSALLTVDGQHQDIAEGLMKKRKFIGVHPDTIPIVERSLKSGLEQVL